VSPRAAIELHRGRGRGLRAQGIRLLQLAGGAQKFFRQQNAAEKRELLDSYYRPGLEEWHADCDLPKTI
jgi:hypothetical protein